MLGSVRQALPTTHNVLHNDLPSASKQFLLSCSLHGHSSQKLPPGSGRVRAMLGAVRQALPATHIVLQGVLPRGGSYGPSSRDSFTWPNRFTAAIAALNARFEVFQALLSPQACLSTAEELMAT